VFLEFCLELIGARFARGLAKKKKENKGEIRRKTLPNNQTKSESKSPTIFLWGLTKNAFRKFSHLHLGFFTALLYLLWGSSAGSIFIECLPGVSNFMFLFFFEAAAALCGCLKQLTGPTDRLMYVDSAFSLLFPSWIFSTLLMKIFLFVLFSFDFAACSKIYVFAGIFARL